MLWPAAIGAGFARLASGRARDRPAGDCAAPRERAPHAATPPRRAGDGHETRLGKGPETQKGKKRSRNPFREGWERGKPGIHPSLNGIRDQKGCRPGISAPPRPGARGVRVGRIVFRARFLRFVARAHPFSAPFEPPLPVSNHQLPAHRCPDLRFCNAPSSTGTLRVPLRRLLLQRTSKNVREPGPRRRACNEPQKMCNRTPASTASRRAAGEAAARGADAPVRNPRTPAGGEHLQIAGGAAGARQRKAISSTFFRSVARLQTVSSPFGVVRGAFGFFLPISLFIIFRLTCGFARRGWRRGRPGRVRLNNKPKKMCTKRLVRGQSRNKPKKTCRQGPAPPPGSERGLRPEGAGRGRRPARSQLVHPREPAGRAQPQPEASRTKPAPIAAG